MKVFNVNEEKNNNSKGNKFLVGAILILLVIMLSGIFLITNRKV